MTTDHDESLLQRPMPHARPRGSAQGLVAQTGQIDVDEWIDLARKKLQALAIEVGAVKDSKTSWYLVALLLALRHEPAFQIAQEMTKGGAPPTRATAEGTAAARKLMELVDQRIAAAAAKGKSLKPSTIYNDLVKNVDTMPVYFRTVGRGGKPASIKTLRDYVASARREKKCEDELLRLYQAAVAAE